MKSDREYLLEAAGIIETRGLAKGEYVFDDGSVCTLGALRIAACGSVGGIFCLSDQQRWQMRRAAHALVDRIKTSILAWNDAPERTASQVIAALRETAESLNEQNGVGG